MINYQKLFKETELEKEFEYREIKYPEIIDEIGVLRIVSWKDEKGVDPVFFSKPTWIEDADCVGKHFAILHKEKVVASARMTFHTTLESVPYYDLLLNHELPYLKFPIASINRLVVHPDFRRKGFSNILDLARINSCLENKINHIIAQPQDIRVEPLQKLGFEIICDFTTIPGFPGRHVYLMILNLENNS